MLVIFFGQNMRRVRCVGSNVGEERLIRVFTLFHPINRSLKKQIGTVTFRFHEFPIVPKRGIDVRIARRVTRLPDATAAVNVDFIETTTLGAIFLFIAKMPFAENASRVTSRLEHLWESKGRQRHPFAATDGVGDAVAEFMASAHQRAATRCAGRTHMKPRE